MQELLYFLLPSFLLPSPVIWPPGAALGKLSTPSLPHQVPSTHLPSLHLPSLYPPYQARPSLTFLDTPCTTEHHTVYEEECDTVHVKECGAQYRQECEHSYRSECEECE